ncbi:hypothetical protein SAMN04489867_3635 [Pedococcus dokdonensis]|uniref:Uncharacterized protein n=1 Tax=Pedococcus dokdonensis TaxID=443156 RepID=A0A1H0V2J8_9MICO|nr:alpha/beta fold hydrolase [Pedococcus dokdonensis]SDP72697.1 hypothetical protein SAMN04489867_3635 [Pedococcus dokdonensis]
MPPRPNAPTAGAERRTSSESRIVILPSPLLGPATYLPLAEALRDRGCATVVASLPASDVMPAAVLAAFRAVSEHHGATVLLAHSNAGFYAPTVAEPAGLPVVFMDAALPAPGVTETRLAPAGFAQFIATLPLADGLLPPWPAWWDRADVAPLFPDDEWLDRATRAAPRLPPDYFTTPLPVPPGWESRPAAYLGFGDTYADELAFATTAGWVVRREEGHHLSHLADPVRVAEVLVDLVAGGTAPR